MIATVARTGLPPSPLWGDGRDEDHAAPAASPAARTTAHPLLQLRKVNSFYGPVQAHFDLDIEVRKGQIVSLLGGNASGKSTTMKIVLGLLKPRSGEVLFDGVSTLGLSTPQIIRQGIGSVPEARRLFPAMTVRENLLMGASARRPGPWNLQRLYGLFPILAEKRRQPGTSLSGGQQQMVALGRALMSNPELLLCDELSLGLAPVVIREIYAAMPGITAEGMAVVIVEQDVTMARQVSRRVYCFQEGRV